jgi:hypothetical protein
MDKMARVAILLAVRLGDFMEASVWIRRLLMIFSSNIVYEKKISLAVI